MKKNTETEIKIIIGGFNRRLQPTEKTVSWKLDLKNHLECISREKEMELRAMEDRGRRKVLQKTEEREKGKEII